MRVIDLLMKPKMITVFAFIFILAFSLIRATYFPEGDIFWGARNGMDTLRTGVHMFQPDTWNLQTLGEEWSPNSWLWNVLLGASYLAFGNYGFLLIALITNMAAYGFLWGYLKKLRMPPLVALLILVASMTIMAMYMNGRSNTVDFLILTVFLYLCRYFQDKLIPLIVMSFLLTVLWINFHMTGIAAAVMFPAIVYATLQNENIRKRFLHTAFVLFSTLLALPMTPYGFEGLIKVSLVKNESKGLISEWSNVFNVPENQVQILTLLGISIVVMLILFKHKQFLYGTLTAALIYGTYDTVRLAPFLLVAILGALVFLDKPSYALSKWHPLIAKFKNNSGTISILLMCATLMLSSISVISLNRAVTDTDNMFYISSQELKLIPENARAAVTQDAGSAIILYRPDVLVTLDGRNDLIGAERFVEASNILYSNDLAEVERWLDKHDINVVFVHDGSAARADIIAENMKTLGWDVRTNETDALAYVKDSP